MCIYNSLMKLAYPIYALAAILATQLAKGADAPITLGTPAPAIQVKSWLKGTPVTTFDANKLYVVEFWATWCGPCKQSIPHLTEMATKNKDVTFVGVSIWEDDKNGNIKQFVDDMGDKMNYNVAYSGNKDGMAETWMQAAGQNGIPTAFVVKGGKIAWIGHPMELEKPLEQIKAGTFDTAAAKAKLDKDQEATRAEQAAMAKLKQAKDLYKQGKKTEANSLLDDAAKAAPNAAMEVQMIRLQWLAKDDKPGFSKKVNELSTSKKPQDLMMLGAFSLSQLDPDGDKALGKQTIETALKASNESDFLTLYYASMFYQKTNDNTSALRVITKARDLLPKTPYNSPQFKEELDKQVKELSTPNSKKS